MSPISLLLRFGTYRSATIGRRYLTTTPALRATASSPPDGNKATSVRHTTDSYAKDVDDTPAPDSQVHRIDALSENVQKPYEAPSGEFSRTGATAAEHAAMNKGGQPCAPKGEGEKQRYGGTKSWVADKGPEMSQPWEGPAGSGVGGRKPEGR